MATRAPISDSEKVQHKENFIRSNPSFGGGGGQPHAAESEDRR